ncbi:P-type conjugative transfer protein TrbL [Bilophila wadsworthia]|uniref:P-type conjugative transfer protein TrbL n=1 Tax=Bilophila wadsworthia TaxID=35833 RepID=UPI002430BC00|nr:P-type conjugative transfer protein TrbL [Bilophila wadsworthia]
MKKNLLLCLGIVILFFILFPNIACAELSNQNMFNSVLAKYQYASSSWAHIIQERAEWLFGSLALISFSWQFSQIVGSRGSSPFTEMIGELLKFVIFCGFYLWLLRNGPDFALKIIRSFMMIGAQAGGQENLEPSGIVDLGFTIYDAAQQNLDIWSGTSIAAYIISLIVLVIFALIGINMLLQLCSAWVLAYAGIFFLGFGGSKWTSDMAVNYFKTVLGLGASLMTMTLLIGIGTSIVTESIAQMDTSGAQNLTEMAVLLITSITLFMLVDKLPSMVAGIINGASVGSTGIGAFGAGAAIGTAAAAMGMAATSISESVSTLIKAGTGGAGLAAGFQAVKNEMMGEQTDIASKMQEHRKAAGLPPESGFAKPPSATAVLGRMAQMGGAMMKQGIKNKASEAVSNTAGGKIADMLKKTEE